MRKKGFVFLETIIILMLVTVALTTMLASYTLVTTKSYEKQYYDRISDKYLLYAITNLGTTQKDNYQKIADQLVINTSSSANDYEKLGILKFDIPNDDCTSKCQELTPSAHRDAIDTYCNIFGNTNGTTNVNSSSFDKKVTGEGNCSVVFEQMQLNKLYIVKDIAHTLKQDEATKYIDNGTIEYMKSLKKCHTENVYVQFENVVSTNLDDCIVETPGVCMCVRDVNGNCKVRRVVKQGLHDDSDPNFKCEEPVQYMIGVFYRNEDYYYASIEL